MTESPVAANSGKPVEFPVRSYAVRMAKSFDTYDANVLFVDTGINHDGPGISHILCIYSREKQKVDTTQHDDLA